MCQIGQMLQKKTRVLRHRTQKRSVSSRIWQRCLVAIAVYWMAMSAQADDSARDWMRRMAEARQQQNYQGVFVYGQGDDLSSVQIAHRFNQGVEEERLLHLDGERREIIRQGDKVTCILPDNEMVELEQILPSGPFAGRFSGEQLPADAQYHIAIAGNGRVAGHDAVKVAVMAQDDFRYSYLLWLEQQSALLLKSLVLDKQGQVLERLQYSSLQLGGEIPDSALRASHPITANSAHATIETTSADAVPMKHAWRPQWLPGGFTEASLKIKRTQTDGMDVDSQVYSDGLTAFSIFVETAPAKPMPDGASQMGATVAYARNASVGNDRYLITVVGEIPLVTARKVAEAMQPQ